MATNIITATKVANRACQRVGAQRIADDALFTEDSNSANEIAACYDILRRAELRRNFWRFSIRRAALRPVSITTNNYIPPAWAVGTTYAYAAIVTFNGTWYSSLIPANVGNTPADDTASWTSYFGPNTCDVWAASTTYMTGEIVYIGTTAYLSLKNANMDLTSVTTSWLQLTGTITLFMIVYPAGVGPSNVAFSQNLFVLPQGFLREAPQNPKSGNRSFLGYPANRPADDWVFENSFFISMDSGVIIFRFAADITNAAEFDPMFVEGLGARIGMEVCERLTQSSAKVQECKDSYKRVMGEARTVNGIEEGATEPPLDDYIATRV